MAQAQTPAQGTAMAVVSDAGTSLSSRLTVTMTGAARAPEGFRYEGWLVGDDGSGPLSVGFIAVGPGGSASLTYDSPDGANLIAAYSQFVISVEPNPDPDPAPSADKPYMDAVPLAAMAHIRHLVVSWPAGSDTGILTDLKSQLDVAIQHSRLARDGATIDDLRTHIHHVINIIEGEGGDNFDAAFGNPGDGVGVLAHAGLRQHAQFAMDAAPGDPAIQMHGANVLQYGMNSETWAVQARDEALAVLDEESLTIARTLTNTVEGRLIAARNGITATGQGGAHQAYLQAQMMAKFQAPSVRGGGAGPSQVGGMPGLPLVGDSSIPMVAQFALLGSIAMLGLGGYLMLRDRRRNRA
jgi:hypothetical protein